MECEFYFNKVFFLKKNVFPTVSEVQTGNEILECSREDVLVGLYKALLLKMRSLDQQHGKHLATCWNCRILFLLSS